MPTFPNSPKCLAALEEGLFSPKILSSRGVGLKRGWAAGTQGSCPNGELGAKQDLSPVRWALSFQERGAHLHVS